MEKICANMSEIFKECLVSLQSVAAEAEHRGLPLHLLPQHLAIYPATLRCTHGLTKSSFFSFLSQER